MIAALLLAAAATYCGEPAPGPEPRLFAPGLVNTGLLTRDLSLAPDGREAWFTVNVGPFAQSAVVVVREAAGRWGPPELAPFSRDARWHDLEPHVAPDGKRLYFVSDRGGGEDIYACAREDDAWGEPVALGAPVNTPAPEFFPSSTRGGTLYFTRTDTTSGTEAIWRARPDGHGGFHDPERLPDVVNAAPTQFNAFVAPDEDWLIVCAQGRPDNLGVIDYWVVFRDADDTWHPPVNLGPLVNGKGKEGWSASLSPDGKALFFMSRRTVYDPAAPRTWDSLHHLHDSPGNGRGHIWYVDAAFIEELRD